MQEREFAAEGWPELYPVSFALPGGFLVVMPRATVNRRRVAGFDYRRFVTRGGEGYVDESFAIYADDWKQGDLGQPLGALALGNAEPASGLVPAEYNRDSFGVLDGRIVAVDYG